MAQNSVGADMHVLQGIVTAHGGAIRVDSKEGIGTRFCIMLPVNATAGAVEAPALTASNTHGGGNKVLYVDDDEVVVLMVQRVLERAGFVVEAHHEPRAALAALRERCDSFSVLITDYSMPAMSGLELAREVRAHCPWLPIIISSGFISDEMREQARRDGIADIVNKENTFEELAERTARIIAAHPGPGP